MQVVNTTLDDLDAVFDLFDRAIDYQRSHGYPLWPVFSRDLIRNEILENRHWKMVEAGKTACVFSVLYSDPVIWGAQRNSDPAVYLHRIAVHPAFKGRNLMVLIRQWAVRHARQQQKKFVRMDTWGHNENLRQYYTRCGFPYIGQQHLPEVNGLPAHYGGQVLSLFELPV